MLNLLERAWALHRHAEADALPHLVRPSVPILFFGDSRLYERSPLKVITVGLNPSKQEFPRGDAFRRFPAVSQLTCSPGYSSLTAYRSALDDYFRIDPYRAWFQPSFEELLLGLGASFFGRAENAALHTDLCSPLATDPTWSQLTDHEKAILVQDGNDLWHQLVEHLQPNIVLISVKRQHLTNIRFPIIQPSRPIFTVDRDRPYVIEMFRGRLESGKEPFFVFGKAAQTPFGLISGVSKRSAGRAIREVVDAG
jgi:hypothetical protein